MLNVRQIEYCRGPKVLTDGQGLRLEVDKSQNKKWIFRFTLNQKRRDMGLGRFPDVGLREARIRRDEARQLVVYRLGAYLVKHSQSQKLGNI